MHFTDGTTKTFDEDESMDRVRVREIVPYSVEDPKAQKITLEVETMATKNARITSGRGELYESVVDTIGNTPCIKVVFPEPKSPLSRTKLP